MLKIGCHVGMSGKEMMLGSVKDAVSFGANTFMLYTGAPQNTRRKEVSELRIEEAHALMAEHGIDEFVVHAPYIINLANTINPATYEIAVEFLAKEIDRATAMGSQTIVLHPGSHVGAGVDIGIASIVKGLNEVLTADTKCNIALETMAGKGSEIGRSFEELAQIYDGVSCNDKLRVCFDTCHTSDAGYDIIHNFDGVMEKFDTLMYIMNHPDFEEVPKILESPYIKDPENSKKSYEPFAREIAMIRSGEFDTDMIEHVLQDNK